MVDADVVIIGAGTAGLSASIYVQRCGRSSLILEGGFVGGQIVNSLDIENYPGLMHVSGYDFAMKLWDQAKELGAQVKEEKALSVEYGKAEEDSCLQKEWAVRTATGAYRCKAVILALGLVRRKLGIEGEDRLTGHGVSYCATCDGAFYKGKDTAVNGGGNTALEDALFLSGLCRRVYLVHRRDAFRADEKEVQKVLAKPNIELVLNSTISSLKEGKDGKLSGIETKDKFTGKIRDLDVSGLFIAIGQKPVNEPFAELVKLDDDGYIVAGEDCKTSVEGIFAAGDCRTKQVRQLATAAADGAVAGLAACHYMDSL